MFGVVHMSKEARVAAGGKERRKPHFVRSEGFWLGWSPGLPFQKSNKNIQANTWDIVLFPFKQINPGSCASSTEVMQF